MPNPIHRSLEVLFRELIDGPDAAAAWMLNPGDAGMLRSLDKLTAQSASAAPAPGRSSIAAHVDHVRYGLSLMNRWGRGESDPWSSADWAASWKRVAVTDQEWAELKHAFESEVRTWLDTLRSPREFSEVELNGVIASVAHLAYHLGAIRQIDLASRGPLAN